jgi:pimeloyl-ACP methyl ester carboxylesterase/ADP-ribose pyrophosphatase YjhB (NUDIX family)
MSATTRARRQVFHAYEAADAGTGGGPLHCARCGLTCRPCRDGERTRPVCPGCGWVGYRNPAPGVAVLVTEGDRVLLGRRAGGTRGGGLWELPGGFVEFDEDFLSAGRREVREETGLEVEITGIVSVTSNFFSPALHSLVIALIASPVGGVLRAGNGFDAVRWVPKAGPFPPLAADADTDFVQMLAGAGLPPSLPVDPRYAGAAQCPPPEPGVALTPAQQLAHFRRAAGVAGVAIDEFVVPKSYQLSLRGLAFHCIDWGVAGRPPILFLHGGGQTARTWDLVCLALRREHRCLAFDQRGHGDSSWSPAADYGPEAHVGDLEALVARLDLRRFVLVGMSMGCINGLCYAIRHPERMAGFVAVDAGPAVRVEGGTRIVEFRERTRVLPSLDDYVAHALRFNPRRDRDLLCWSLLHNLRRLPDGRLAWKTDPYLRIDPAVLVQRLETLWGDLHRVRCPTLVVRGAESDVFLDEDAERFARALPDGRWVRVEHAGHTIQGDNPRGLVDELRRFLAEPTIQWDA